MHFSPYTRLGLLSQVVTSEGHGLRSVQAAALPLKCPLDKPTQVWVNEETHDCRMLLGDITKGSARGRFGDYRRVERRLENHPKKRFYDCKRSLAR